MKNGLLVFAILSCAVLNSGCSRKLMPEGRFQDTPVKVDGKVDDWGLPLRFSNPAYSMQYAVTNDDKNIYVCIYSKDESFQMRMLKAGMSICFDPKGEKDKKMSLVFPVKKPDDHASNNNGNPTRYTDTRTVKDQLILQSDYYNTTGLVNMDNGQYSITDQKSKIQVAIRLNDDSSLVYEAAIPIRYILGNDLRAGYDPQNFSVGIVVNEIHHTAANNNGYHPHSSYGGGMRGMHGMGMGSNYGSNNNSNNNPAPKPEEDWYAFRLVYKKV